MYHLRLIKGLSYLGCVKATRSNPDVFVDDEVKYKRLLSSGYFADVTASDSEEVKVYEPHKTDDAVLEELADSVTEEETNALDSMSITELKAYATVNGIDLGKKRRREDILKLIKETEERADEARKALVES